MEFEGKYNTKSPAVKRLMKEALELREPTDQYNARPLEENLFEWHFTIEGPTGTEFEGGLYHGRIIFPSEYPMKPPNIILLTSGLKPRNLLPLSYQLLKKDGRNIISVQALNVIQPENEVIVNSQLPAIMPGKTTAPNGRFEVNKKICLSISDHHPETWQPCWSIRTALLALIAFMPTPGNGTIGALNYPEEERKQLAFRSHSWECNRCGKMSEQLNKCGVANITTDESVFIQNVVFKGEEPPVEVGEIGDKRDSSPNENEDIPQVPIMSVYEGDALSMNEQTQQQQTTDSPNVSSRCYRDSVLNVIIGIIVAAIAFLIYRRMYLVQ